jgi:hypothetical protein
MFLANCLAIPLILKTTLVRSSDKYRTPEAPVFSTPNIDYDSLCSFLSDCCYLPDSSVYIRSAPLPPSVRPLFRLHCSWEYTLYVRSLTKRSWKMSKFHKYSLRGFFLVFGLSFFCNLCY